MGGVKKGNAAPTPSHKAAPIVSGGTSGIAAVHSVSPVSPPRGIPFGTPFPAK